MTVTQKRLASLKTISFILPNFQFFHIFMHSKLLSQKALKRVWESASTYGDVSRIFFLVTFDNCLTESATHLKFRVWTMASKQTLVCNVDRQSFANVTWHSLVYNVNYTLYNIHCTERPGKQILQEKWTKEFGLFVDTHFWPDQEIRFGHQTLVVKSNQVEFTLLKRGTFQWKSISVPGW